MQDYLRQLFLNIPDSIYTGALDAFLMLSTNLAGAFADEASDAAAIPAPRSLSSMLNPGGAATAAAAGDDDAQAGVTAAAGAGAGSAATPSALVAAGGDAGDAGDAADAGAGAASPAAAASPKADDVNTRTHTSILQLTSRLSGCSLTFAAWVPPCFHPCHQAALTVPVVRQLDAAVQRLTGSLNNMAIDPTRHPQVQV